MQSIEQDHVGFNNSLMLERMRLPKGRPNPNFELSTRVRNRLESKDILYVGQLAAMTEGQLAKISRLGPEAILEIKEVLKSKGLALATDPVTQDLSTPEALIKFYSIKGTPEVFDFLTNQQAGSKKPFSKIFVAVSLPSSAVKDKTDTEILLSIREVCQRAFEKAVKQSVIDELSYDETEEMSPSKPKSKPSKSSRPPSGPFKEMIVPLYLPSSLTVNFKDSLVEKVTKDLGGLALYKDLKPCLHKAQDRNPL